jgi:hypothetical protein
VERWRSTRLAEAATFAYSGGHGVLRAQDLAWPAQQLAGMTVHSVNLATDSANYPVFWSIPVGAGRLFVSGALDAWHHRDPGASDFDSFWPNVIAELSAGAPPHIEVSLSSRALRPGQEATVRVRFRDVVLSSSPTRSAEASAILVAAKESTLVRLWPTRDAGTFTGTFVAPSQSGTYRLVVASGVDRGDVPFMVDSSAMTLTDDSLLVNAFVSSRSGFTVSESNLSGLSRRLAAAFPPVSRVETWYPMRSPLWIIPFTLMLGAEWWWRRRRGLA